MSKLPYNGTMWDGSSNNAFLSQRSRECENKYVREVSLVMGYSPYILGDLSCVQWYIVFMYGEIRYQGETIIIRKMLCYDNIGITDITVMQLTLWFLNIPLSLCSCWTNGDWKKQMHFFVLWLIIMSRPDHLMIPKKVFLVLLATEKVARIKLVDYNRLMGIIDLLGCWTHRVNRLGDYYQ